ncbi:NAD(P)-dependent alcohol dehydrogenase [Bartonella sp. HY329]|uniref:NAD(P)-dependent alcohol dehydrogenase n=1 Tax=unclassified Bartonella TaxID=2645622 RepID=UPI0021C90305|nr:MULTISPECIES: NAD(P)-dependent alcohol dehydrogenase [unclassified Bartonella]UXM96285.1 NAD(P)-dependent alcohol dehydrogenase [Bartonella sp. HY329]UXN10609.1 NAD(P)-dependent alcohol dehydrogenase [Bartonella sp. HY328]
MFICDGFAVSSASDTFQPFSFERRDPLAFDVDIDIAFCGICHSDLHTARGEWAGTQYPCVPGHEIVGTVRRIGSKVTKFKVGQRVGVGCMVNSCQNCDYCSQGLEQYCENGNTLTYNSPDPETGPDRYSFGGYSKRIVVNENFVLSIPDNLDLAAAAPLLCAGITTFSPLNHWKVTKGTKVGVAGLGGLGHMAVKLAHAMGAEVTMLTTSVNKVEDAHRLGADNIVLTKDSTALAKANKSLDLIIDTVAAQHDINQYFNLLRVDGTLVQVGAPVEPLPVQVFNLIPYRRSFAGSAIGGIAETQKMLDFCGEHNITADIELIAPSQIEQAYARMLKSDVKYRFVMDMSKA